MYFCASINQKKENMKKLFTILCAGLLTFGLSAQTETGNIMMGVNSNFSFESYTDEGADEGNTTFGLNASGGYFVIDNLAVLATLGYESLGEDMSTMTYGVGVRYYMNSIFGHVAYNMGSSSISDLDVSTSQIALGAGYSHMLTDNIALEPMLNYVMDSVEGEASGSGFGLKIGFGLYF
tara:strand:+ start:38 stop:574 length:537 start_codon:yes stop_codon:yes gene_type:complete